MLATKKLATVRSNVSVSSKPRNKWIKKRNDFVSLYLMTSEDDYPDMDRDNKSLILSSSMHKRHKVYSTRRDTASMNPIMKYPTCGTGVHRLSSRGALIKNMKRKFDIKMNTACYENECKFKRAMDDVKRKTYRIRIHIHHGQEML